MALMPQVVLQDGNLNKNGDDATLLNDEQYNTKTAHGRTVKYSKPAWKSQLLNDE
jgi:hypothetical protein